MSLDPNRMFVPEMNPSKCPCQGRGWFLSDYDTWHRCPIHGVGLPHPEDEDAQWTSQQTWVHHRDYCREAYKYFWRQSGLSSREFLLKCTDEVKLRWDFVPHPHQWVDAADAVAEREWQEQADRDARAQGYSCRLEAALAAEAVLEAGARHRNMDPDEYATRGSPERADADRWYRWYR